LWAITTLKDDRSSKTTTGKESNMLRRAGETGTCPYCRKGVRFEAARARTMTWSGDPEKCVIPGGYIEYGDMRVESASKAVDLFLCTCPNCGGIVFTVAEGSVRPLPLGEPVGEGSKTYGYVMLWPRVSERPVPPEVPREIAQDFTEACLVLPFSSKASAALSRRCLQHLLVDAANVTKDNLHDQIQEVLDTEQVPSWLAENLDHVRVIGNFAAHPSKSKATGEIVEVEPGEADWNLDVLESLFDFY